MSAYAACRRSLRLGRGTSALGKLCLLSILACVAGDRSSLVAQNALIGESEVKAAFLYNFAKFVDWPSERFTSQSSPVIIGTLANDTFDSILERTVASRTAQGRPVVVRRLQQLSEDTLQCHVVFVGSSKREAIADLLRLTKDANVLTVSETEGFAQRGGIMNFVFSDSKIRFEVNNLSAKRSGLRISSKLLQLAANVWE